MAQKGVGNDPTSGTARGHFQQQGVTRPVFKLSRAFGQIKEDRMRSSKEKFHNKNDAKRGFFNPVLLNPVFRKMTAINTIIDT